MSLNYQNLEHAVRNTMSLYVNKRQMFTVYQIWSDTQQSVKTPVSYSDVRRVVESIINDSYSSLPGWTRTVGQHLRNLDNSVGKAGEAPQIYHPVGADITKYDPDFRLHQQIKVPAQPLKIVVEQPKGTVVASTKKGLFKFKVWFNGSLVGCNLVNPRGNGGKFVSNPDYEGHGVLDSGVPVLVRQDAQGKLYAVSIN